jgi:hypothetical protein
MNCELQVDKSTAELKEKKALIEELQTAIVEAKPGGTTVKSESGVEGEDGDGEKTGVAGKGSLKRAGGWKKRQTSHAQLANKK